MKRLNLVAESYAELFPAQEELASGQTQVEDEVTLYARMMDQSLLKHASSSEEQEQWEVKIKDTFGKVLGRIRVRKTYVTPIQYVQTVKIKNSEGSQDETSFEVTADVFEQFKKLSDTGMHKTRYFFDVEGRPEKWEVDTFKTADGSLSDHVKIDFEFAEGQPRTLPPLPLGFTNVIRGDTTVEGDRAVIQRLYDEVFFIQVHPLSHV